MNRQIWRKDQVDIEQPVHLSVIASQNHDELVEEARFCDAIDQLVDSFLCEQAFAETICLVHEEHFAERVFNEGLRLRTSLADVLAYEIFG